METKSQGQVIDPVTICAAANKGVPAEAVPKAMSTADLLTLYPRLGIPHFQRGLVWTTDSLSLLLESLYYGTPCGNIILWRSNNPRGNGVPLDKSTDAYDLLVLDGQQRIRSLYQLLGGGDDAGESDDGAEDDVKPGNNSTWCMDLTVEPTFEGYCERHDRRRSLFVHMQDPLGKSKVQRYNFIPLRYLMSGPYFPPEVNSLIRVREDAGEIKSALTAICQKATGMVERKLFSTIELVESAHEHRLGDVVRLYNRINSGGSRVAAEEKAFATLVRLTPSVNDHMREYFAAVHGAKTADDSLVARDDMLKRRKESRFGFKLYIRTFAQICNYHFARSSGTQGLSFDILDNPQLQQSFLESASASKVESLYNETTSILLAIRRILEKVLHCDDLRMLPEPSFFVPVVQLMVRYPDLRSGGYDEAMGYLLLHLVLGERYSQAWFLELAGVVDRSHTAEACLRHLAREIRPAAHAKRGLLQNLKYSNSLNSRHALLLYWLVRHNQAGDLSYRNLPSDNPLHARTGSEMIISADCSPEKQHLVPASVAGRLYGAAARVATSSHQANNIGNLTYISHELNCLEGLSDTWVNPAFEPVANAVAHYLHPDQLGDTFQGMVERKEVRTKTAYEQFTQRRRDAIAEGFLDWLGELERAFVVEERIRPAVRHFYTHEADLVRMLAYPDAVEDALIRILPMLKKEKCGQGWMNMKIKQRRGEPTMRVYFMTEPTGRIEIENKDAHPFMHAITECMLKYGYTVVGDCPYSRAQHQASRWIIPVDSHSAGQCITELAGILAP